MESATVQFLVQGGSVGVALAALWILYKISSNHIEHHEMQISRFADLMEKDLIADKAMAESQTKMAEAINRLTDKLHSK